MRCAVLEASNCRIGPLVVRLKYLLLATTLIVSTFLILVTNSNMNINLESSNALRYNLIQQHTGGDNYINSQRNHTIKGCSIPVMKPLSPAIKQYIQYPSGYKSCHNKSSRSLLDSDEKEIWINETNLRQYNLNETEAASVRCCYQAFTRPEYIADITSSRVDDRVKYGNCLNFRKTIRVRDEFVKVTCSTASKKLYEQYFLFAPKKLFMKHNNKGELKDGPAYNVLILGIDAVSRLNFHRTMPKTLSLLLSKGAVEMMGYNKVGDNTFPNLIPMLMGIKDTELKKVCLPHRQATFDNCPFIWEWYKQAGYYTAIGEDSSNLGTFNYLKVGFSNTPSDYYLHTFIHEAEHNVGWNKDFNSFLCMQEKPFYKVLLDYVEDLTTALKSSKLFGFFWEVTMSHDYLNYPMIMDDDYVQFFNKLEVKNYLNETIVIVVSDHGIRWGGIRSTKQGRLEERLPFLYVLTPPSFRENYTQAYNNLKQNHKRLTTPFDVYATLTDLIDLKSINETSLLSRSKTSYSHKRGISLFLPVPYNRTCEAADIDDHWCTCHRDVNLSNMSPEARDAAANLVVFLNEILAEYPQCAVLSLSDVLDATKKEAGTPDKGEVGWKEYMVVVKMTPGDAIFEATLRKDDGAWVLVGSVSRVNLYGEQSHCVDDYNLKLYCYCD